MFWGVTLESGKRYSQVVDTSYHLSMAALEPRQGGEPVMVMLEHGKAEFLLCTLDQGSSRQVPLDLNFVEGEEVTFFLNGKGTVHLTGYLTDGLQDDESSDEEASPDEEEEDQENELAAGDHTSRKPSKRTKKKPKQSLLQAFNGESDDESDADFDVDQVEDETEDDDDDDDDADEEVSEEEDPQPLSLVQRNRLPQKRPADKAVGNASASGEKRASSVPSTPADDTIARKKRKRSKKQHSETPTADSDNMEVQSPQTLGNKGVTKQLPGGVICTELRAGSGPQAKPGRVMHVYYTGRLSNNKVFDSCTSGKAFCFRLGKHEVIKGWDTGIQGMKVGGKRRLVIPPSQAYGNTRMGAIPPNSTLYFDVELKAVS